MHSQVQKCVPKVLASLYVSQACIYVDKLMCYFTLLWHGNGLVIGEVYLQYTHDYLMGGSRICVQG